MVYLSVLCGWLIQSRKILLTLTRTVSSGRGIFSLCDRLLLAHWTWVIIFSLWSCAWFFYSVQGRLQDIFIFFKTPSKLNWMVHDVCGMQTVNSKNATFASIFNVNCYYSGVEVLKTEKGKKVNIKDARDGKRKCCWLWCGR